MRANPENFVVLDIETTDRHPWKGRLLCVGIGDTALPRSIGLKRAAPLLASDAVVVCHTSYDLAWLGRAGLPISPELRFHDTRVMAWLLEGNESLALDDLCTRWLGYTPPKLISRVGGALLFESKAGPVPLADAPWAELAAYNKSDLSATRELYIKLRATLQRERLWTRFIEHEVPLSGAILEMEWRGLPFDERACAALREHVSAEAEELKTSLVADAGLPASFNPGSSKQVADYIFGKGAVRLGDRVEVLPALTALIKQAKQAAKDPKAIDPAQVANASGQLPAGFIAERVGRLWAHGYWVVEGRAATPAEAGFGASVHWKEAHKERKRESTSSLSLVLKNPEDEWIGDLVLWRELTKLGGSFLARFPDFAYKGRLYGSINRTGTATGRFSSSAPNLQQIPAHGNYGAHVRGLFHGTPMAVGDYSQLEQRIAGHLSGDANLLKAYREGVDLYGLAASICFGGEPSKDHPQRGLMKTGMLALQYGAGAAKLAQLLLVDGHEGATTEYAQDLIDKLKRVFPTFFQWRDDVVLKAARNGYVETIGGRRRPLKFPDNWARMKIFGRFGNLTREEVRAGFAIERQAVNTECQGGAADVVAEALCAIRRELHGAAGLLVQVHDEILIERLEGWDAASLAAFQRCCEEGHGIALDVPLAFEAHEVESWAEKSGGSARHVSSGFQKRVKEARSEGLQSRKASTVARRRREEKASSKQ